MNWDKAAANMKTNFRCYCIVNRALLCVVVVFCFVFSQSATLLSGQEQPEPKSSASDDSSSSEEEDDDQKLDLSTTFK